MNDRFSVAVGAVLMTVRFKLRAQFAVVIDFAVENDVNRPVFIRHRLLPVVQINDGQAAMAERHAGPQP